MRILLTTLSAIYMRRKRKRKKRRRWRRKYKKFIRIKNKKIKRGYIPFFI
jgi:hypothetical protein